MATYTKLTRVYKLKGGKALKEQTIMVLTSSVTSIRASNRLGFPGHRSTITLVGGAEIDLSEKSAAVLAALQAR